MYIMRTRVKLSVVILSSFNLLEKLTFPLNFHQKAYDFDSLWKDLFSCFSFSHQKRTKILSDIISKVVINVPGCGFYLKMSGKIYSPNVQQFNEQVKDFRV